MSSRKIAKKPVTKRAATVLAWQDDPQGLPAVTRPVPRLVSPPLSFRIKGPAVPAGLYQAGTPEFRYWAAAEALRRGADFWAPLLGVKRWQPGAVLPVGLDEGQDLNAYYNRQELAFFHDTVDGRVVYSGESPDAVCHEMGHACLDAHRPQLWDAPFVEVGAFHESFGDTSAILSALQLPSVRTAALDGVRKARASVLSRLAEQLGWAIRQVSPSDAEPDCLRNACNGFSYVDPETLPDSAPASQLSAEVHSFSRVFTGAFYQALSGMLGIRSRRPTEADLARVATDYALLLLDATAAAPAQPDYFAQVAAHLIDADTSRFQGKYRAALVGSFVERKILPAASVKDLVAYKGRSPRRAFGMTTTATGRAAGPEIHTVELRAKDFGLEDVPLLVRAPLERKPFRMVAAALLHEQADPVSGVERATTRFVTALFAHRRVDTTTGARGLTGDAKVHEHLRKTHLLIKGSRGLQLVRRHFNCGCRS